MGISLKKFFGRRLNEKGQEVPDPTPVELPIGYKHPLPLEQRMRQMIKTHLSSVAQQEGFESWEEANDFKMPDESDDGLYLDEDDSVAANDPFVERAFHEESAALVTKRQKSAAEKKAAAEKAAGAAESASIK